jgi:FAD/FMN-containing dehydrogenase
MSTISLLDRAGNALSEDKVDAFAAQIRGRLLMADDPEYEDARHIWNALVEKHPGAILKCSGTADVVAAVNFARDNDILAAVRGGGHNVGGRALCDNGLVIDLSEMRAVFVDPAARTVRVQGGATLGDVDRETHLHGLAVPLGVISKTGVAGLTLGGGVGWLARKYGPSCDNVIEMEVVTADGTVRTVNGKENADLYWAMRGGGGNFGVVTSFLYQAYPVSTVLGGLIVYPRDAAGEVLRGYRDFMENAPADLNAYAGMICTPDGTPASAIILCWSGADLEAGAKAVEPLKKLAEPMMVAVEPMPFPAMQSMLDDGFQSGSRNYWKSTYVTGLPDSAIDTLVEQAKGMTSPASGMLIECHGGGAVGSHGGNAFAQRDARFLVAIMPMWADASEDDAQIAWARSTWEAMQPYSSGGTLLSYISAGEEDAIKAAFGSNYPRLQQLKRDYDPTNFFSQNQNIQPAA